MNKDHEIKHQPNANPSPESTATTGMNAPPRYTRPYDSGGEMRPGQFSGWRRAKARERYFAAGIHAVSFTGWQRRGIYVISALEVTEAPDGRGDNIPQWHLSLSADGGSRRCDDEEVKQTLASFGLTGAEEDNHHPGAARHFWMPVDPIRRIDCSCKATEETIVEPDGYRYSQKRRTCAGCELEVEFAARGVARPCPDHQRDLIVGADGNILPTVRSAAEIDKAERAFLERELAHAKKLAQADITGRLLGPREEKR